MTSINRRSLIGGVGSVGAGLALAACSRGQGGESNAAVETMLPGNGSEPLVNIIKLPVPAEISGVGFSHDSSGIHGPSGHQIPNGVQNASDYQPQHTALAYIRFKDGKILARHAYFSIKPNDAAITTFIKDQFDTISASATASWKNHATFIREGSNFHQWWFGSQGKIFILVDGGTNVVLDERNLIQFTPYSARIDPTTNLNYERAVNNAFLNPTPVTIGGRRLISIENWNRDENGKEISVANGNTKEYSMNIYLLMSFDGGAGVSDIPLVIDPDTGNMGSRP